ncbi:aromatic ring-hydroxylating dioxygenase subunit alpha [Paraburkholderia sediminicola]|uniref:Rieske 2Fe-2S domain-containing protein n=1 Tax=Paraburkholderia sediminicola TaxID=458836 RepID=UPI0038BE1B9B
MSFIKNTWYAAMWSQNLPEDGMVHTTVIGELLVLYRDMNGLPVVLQDRCPHRFAPLHLGKLCAQKSRIQCGYHGLEFDNSGLCVHNPHSETIPSMAKVRAFKAVERHSLIWVWMGDSEPLENAIPDFSLFSEVGTNRISRRESIELEVNYQLMTDNLLDLSHVSFLHDGVLGHAGMVRGEITVEQDGSTLHVKRSSPNVAPPGMFDLLYKRNGLPVDFWADMRWNAPACMLNNAGVCQPGSDRSAGISLLGAHILTPISEFRTMYHFAAARFDENVRRNADDERFIFEQVSNLRRYAFEEQDEPMVLAQQTAQIAAGGLGVLKPVLLNIDAGPMRARRLLEELRQIADSSESEDA